MRIACVYTVERGDSQGKPLPHSMYIPFGISTIATILKREGHDVDLLVYAENSGTGEPRLRKFIEETRPKLVCLTAVSSQFPFVRRMARVVRDVDPTIFIVLGGHHASLAPDHAMGTADLDAICVGEGDAAAPELARKIEAGEPVAGVQSLWIRNSAGEIEKNPRPEFTQDLDAVPYIDRTMWEPWTKYPDIHPAVLLGRGCPFRCTYCSNHAMQQLNEGGFLRLRSPANVVGEIEAIVAAYPEVQSIYLEVETIAHQKEAFPLFEALAAYNEGREKKVSFGLNFTVTSTFIRNEEKVHEFLQMLKKAHVAYLNIGLESGSEELRKDVLRRPRYSNEEFIRFAHHAKKYEIGLHFYVLVGVPGETVAHYKESVNLVRATQPEMVSLSIFYPYVGTDLYTVAVEQGLIKGGELDPHGQEDELDAVPERRRAVLDMPGFSRRRVRLEYILFWYRAFRGQWPLPKIVFSMIRCALDGSPKTWAAFWFALDRSGMRAVLRKYNQARRRRLEQKARSPWEHRPNEIKVG